MTEGIYALFVLMDAAIFSDNFLVLAKGRERPTNLHLTHYKPSHKWLGYGYFS